MIETLILRSNNIGPQGAEAIGKAFAYNSTISHFDISNNAIGMEGGMAIAASLQINPVLIRVFVSGCSIPPAAMIALTTVLQSNNDIEVLDISNNLIGSASLSQTCITNVMQHLASTFEDNYGLKNVFLSKLGITDWIITDFLAGAIRLNQNLVTIDLSRYKVSDLVTKYHVMAA